MTAMLFLKLQPSSVKDKSFEDAQLSYTQKKCSAIIRTINVLLYKKAR